MDHAPRTSARASQGRSLLRRTGLAICLPALAWTLAPATVGLAASEAGSIQVAWQATVSFVGCSSPCHVSYTGNASGNITGIDNGKSYSVFWPGPAGSAQNATVQYDYAALCNLSTPTSNGVNVSSGIVTASGAELVYDGQPSTAQVEVDFSASPVQNTLVVAAYLVRITGGPAPITIAPPTVSGGALQMVPTAPAVGCLNSNTQGYAISGTLVTFNPV
jgi:hypothetical protein